MSAYMLGMATRYTTIRSGEGRKTLPAEGWGAASFIGGNGGEVGQERRAEVVTYR